MKIERAEVVPGLVGRLDPVELANGGGCTTNATKTAAEDRAVRGEHMFLVLLVDDVDDQVLAAPLYSRFEVGGEALNEALKSGPPSDWIGSGHESNCSKWQHWWIPTDVFCAASASEPTIIGARRHYALGNPEALTSIADWRLQNRNQFREL